MYHKDNSSRPQDFPGQGSRPGCTDPPADPGPRLVGRLPGQWGRNRDLGGHLGDHQRSPEPSRHVGPHLCSRRKQSASPSTRTFPKRLPRYEAHSSRRQKKRRETRRPPARCICNRAVRKPSR
jgi:hypothetical protein